MRGRENERERERERERGRERERERGRERERERGREREKEGGREREKEGERERERENASTYGNIKKNMYLSRRCSSIKLHHFWLQLLRRFSKILWISTEMLKTEHKFILLSCWFFVVVSQSYLSKFYFSCVYVCFKQFKFSLGLWGGKTWYAAVEFSAVMINHRGCWSSWLIYQIKFEDLRLHAKCYIFTSISLTHSYAQTQLPQTTSTTDIHPPPLLPSIPPTSPLHSSPPPPPTPSYMFTVCLPDDLKKKIKNKSFV